jgi:hypothetical protein
MASGTLGPARAARARHPHDANGRAATAHAPVQSKYSSGIYSRLTLGLHSGLHGLYGGGVPREDSSKFRFVQPFELLPATDTPRFALNSPKSAGMSIALVQSVPYFDSPTVGVPDYRALLRVLVTGVTGTATAFGLVAIVTVSSASMITLGLSRHPNGPYAHAKPTLRDLALSDSAPMLLGPPQMPQVVEVPVANAPVLAAADHAAQIRRSLAIPFIPMPAVTAAAKRAAPAKSERVVAEAVPLPLARPHVPEATPPVKLALASPDVPVLQEKPLQKQATLPPASHNPVLPPAGSKIALYDISGHTVYLPNGRRLEAHSGVGERMDEPSQIRVKMRGPTPPNIYRLTLRETLFHGVRAIRLNPTDYGKMYGRDGMLAHTYMLGSSGQSNGCVSFKNYNAFLQAYLNGEVDRMVVVQTLSDAPTRIADAMRDRVASAE